MRPAIRVTVRYAGLVTHLVVIGLDELLPHQTR